MILILLQVPEWEPPHLFQSLRTCTCIQDATFCIRIKRPYASLPNPRSASPPIFTFQEIKLRRNKNRHPCCREETRQNRNQVAKRTNSLPSNYCSSTRSAISQKMQRLELYSFFIDRSSRGNGRVLLALQLSFATLRTRQPLSS